MQKYQESDCSFCTLFNAAYLDRGITMLRSLINVSGSVRIYVLAMDEETLQVLQALKLDKVVPVCLEDFENNELESIKKERTLSEYCWTCTAFLIQYVLCHYSEKICTYIDADLFFYENPFCLVWEMVEAGCSVQIVEHRFGKGIYARHMLHYSGRFCVQFNTFENTEESLAVLKRWAGQCLEYCSSVQDGNRLGDQKYLEEWPGVYKCVHVMQNEGGGVAPWNIHLYRRADGETGNVQVINKYSKKKEKLIFYHFHGLQLLGDERADINVYARNTGIQKGLVDELYVPYIRALYQERRQLEEKFIFLKDIFKRTLIVGITEKGKKSLRLKGMGERLYCRIRSLLLQYRRKKDLLYVGNNLKDSRKGV